MIMNGQEKSNSLTFPMSLSQVKRVLGNIHFSLRDIAIFKCRRIDICDTATESHAGKTVTRLECIRTNFRDAIGNSYIYKTVATAKRRITDGCNAIGYSIITFLIK